MKWEMAEGSKTFIYELNDKGTNKWSALFENNKGYKGEAEKAAQMALAAPDMLEAMKEALPELRGLAIFSDVAAELVIKFEAAIKKAKGEL